MSEMCQKYIRNSTASNSREVIILYMALARLHFAMFPFGLFATRKASRSWNMFREKHEAVKGLE